MRENKQFDWRQTPFTGIMLVKLLLAHTMHLWARQTYTLENDGTPHVTEETHTKHIIKTTPEF